MGQPLIVLDTPLQGVKLIESTPFVDERGEFCRWFCSSTLESLLTKESLSNEHFIRQVNHCMNLRAGTVRGMHFQAAPAEEFKFVRCIRGKVFDVVLDLREHSSTYCQYVAVELSAENHLMLLIPPGCAHGYQVLEDDSHLLYLHTQDYQAQLQSGVHVSDPAFAIEWPLPIQLLSEKDQSFRFLSKEF
jgi:dTDP-4-dehydrorhamnose 3,5-epimerase